MTLTGRTSRYPNRESLRRQPRSNIDVRHRMADTVSRAIPIVFVAGNPECYGASIQESIRDAREFADRFPAMAVSGYRPLWKPLLWVLSGVLSNRGIVMGNSALLRQLTELPDELDALCTKAATEGFQFMDTLVKEWRPGGNCFDAPGEDAHNWREAAEGSSATQANTAIQTAIQIKAVPSAIARLASTTLSASSSATGVVTIQGTEPSAANPMMATTITR